ncbi:MAG: TRAP transporter substrate-binding protein [Acidobacteria bacterium]|nr:TRAP transporter substrate-binding protein [Acidobacteriota bacterium]
MIVNRRSFLAGTATLASPWVFAKRLQAADFRFAQYHNQAVESSLHQRLVQMWGAVRDETNGRVETDVFAENNKVAGSDPAALKMLVAGEIQFFTLMGGILANVVPATDVQQVPFAFASEAAALKAMDGPLGAYLRQEMAAKGIFGFPVMSFDNGVRQIAGRLPIARPEDLVGVRVRVPDGALFHDTFRALGAEPVTINVNGIYDGLKSGKVDAQENPLAVVELFRLYEVVRYISMTNHMWSGFNLMANLPTWNRLPEDVRRVIGRNAEKYVRLQRADQAALNGALRARIGARGVIFNDAAPGPFRAKLSGLYATWKERLGSRCWSLLEAEVGRIGNRD